MYVYDQNDNNISFDEWISACEYQPTKESGLIKIESKSTITFIFKEDYERIKEYINGERKIPSINDANEILGDIEGGNLFQTSPNNDDYYIKDINDIVDSRGQVPHKHYVFGEYSTVHNNDKEYLCEHYSHRKGYPSFMWDITRRQ